MVKLMIKEGCVVLTVWNFQSKLIDSSNGLVEKALLVRISGTHAWDVFGDFCFCWISVLFFMSSYEGRLTAAVYSPLGV